MEKTESLEGVIGKVESIPGVGRVSAERLRYTPKIAETASALSLTLIPLISGETLSGLSPEEAKPLLEHFGLRLPTNVEYEKILNHARTQNPELLASMLDGNFYEMVNVREEAGKDKTAYYEKGEFIEDYLDAEDMRPSPRSPNIFSLMPLIIAIRPVIKD